MDDFFLGLLLVNRPPGTTPLELLTQEVREDEGILSYRQADVAVVENQIVGVTVSFASEQNEATPELEAMIPRDRLAALADFFNAEVPKSWYVDTLWVDAAYRRRGIGRELLNRAQARGQAAGRSILSLMSWAAKTGAIVFYKAQGFEQVRIVPVGQHPAMPHPEGFVLLQRSIPS
ncbi:MAG: GNAT family N-acetyltransferase [Spirulina sp. SIO3F2]|nr:GNAT family N-acetyltransferase [Spirulina sp. SIO3F2]